MNSLLDKYRNEDLTGTELQRFREMLDTLDDDTLAQMLDEYDRSDRKSIDSFTLPDDVVERMRRRCFEKTGITRAKRTSHMIRWVLWAAAVLVPVLLVSTIYLFNQSRDYKGMAETDIAIMTGEGERVTTQLPDGTRVELNYLSELRYTLTAFNSHQRRVNFSGEGFFDVTKNEEAPFIIASKELEVVVRGTAFNLQARDGEEFAELFLERGAVDLKSRRQTAKLKSGQMARLDYATGRIDVTALDSASYLSWRTGDMLFHDEPIEKVIGILAANYNYQIELNTNHRNITSHFTGRIPSNNFNEALHILEYSYNLKARINDRTVTLTTPN